MKKPLLLLQFRPSPTAEHEIECIKRAMKLKNKELEVVNVTEGDTLPAINDLRNYNGVILGASSDYNISSLSKDIKSKCYSVKPVIKYLIKNDIPTLGICFGHQLLALFSGGKVERDETQAEAGVVKVYLNDHSDKTILFNGFPKSFYLASGHKDSVTKLPKGAKNLAYSSSTRNSIFQIKNDIFGIQQHPELNIDGLVWRLSLFPEYMRDRTLEEVKNDFRPMPYAQKFLLNFKKLLS